MDITDRGRRLIELHTAPEILSVVNVWDAVSARVIADLPGTTALATASHSIAATFGYPDGEQIPLDLHLGMIERIVHAAGDLPVSADLEAGYGDAGETIRRAIGVGVVGANLEDRLAPLAESVAAVEAAVRAAEAESVPFALNARTDTFLKPGDRPTGEVLADAIERGTAYLGAGATTFFVPGRLTDEEVEELVAALGEQRISVIGVPGAQSSTRFQDLGVARISYGPWSQRVALTALQDTAAALYAGEGIPATTRVLN
ncbi:isocitrate lyase/phosphoenolpyruvate mutase family protein [Naasia sp. SYSU D00057]|uniref:isocitrate lyase/PEP mutase family protein n=1 Tax=Naasia sp. SYSU D00057 TaxID=2817380 RepID=UPI001B301F0D|nr:isocitrate lyase/phosphoenolpyruvate mutase family protein [Naasia sp. SYSU D00057]